MQSGIYETVPQILLNRKPETESGCNSLHEWCNSDEKQTIEGGRGVLDLAIHSRGCFKPAFNPKGYKVLAISKGNGPIQKKVCIQSKGLQLSFIQKPANENMYCRLKSSRIRHSSHY